MKGEKRNVKPCCAKYKGDSMTIDNSNGDKPFTRATKIGKYRLALP